MSSGGMIGALVKKVGRMRPVPQVKWGQWNLVPGVKYVLEDTTIEETEDPALKKLDAMILKGLKRLRKDKVKAPLQTMLEWSAEAARGKPESSVEFLVFARLLEDTIQIQALRRMRSNEDLDECDSLYYGCNKAVALRNLSEALCSRGLLKRS